MPSITDPTDGSAQVKVWSDSGLNYVCVNGSGASAYSYAACGVYTGGATPPSSFPGLGGTPNIVQVAVDGSGNFTFCPPAPVGGAAAALHTPYPSNTAAVWFQDSSLNWTDTPVTSTFTGKYFNQTDCLSYGGVPAPVPVPPEPQVTEELIVELPVAHNIARVVMRHGTGYICVRGGNAFDDFQEPDLAVAVKIYRPGCPVPESPPLADPGIRIAPIVKDNQFDLSVPHLLVPGAAATKGLPRPCNKLVLWPLYNDGTWGEPKQIIFYGHKSKHTDCHYVAAPPGPAPAAAPGPAPAPAPAAPCGCKDGEEKAKGDGKKAPLAKEDDESEEA